MRRRRSGTRTRARRTRPAADTARQVRSEAPRPTRGPPRRCPRTRRRRARRPARSPRTPLPRCRRSAARVQALAGSPAPRGAPHPDRGAARARSRLRRAFALAPIALDGPRHLDAGGNAELEEDVTHVRLDGLGAEEERRGDLAVRLAVGRHGRDLELAFRQRRDAAVARGRRPAWLDTRPQLAQLAAHLVAHADRAARVKLALGLAQHRDRLGPLTGRRKRTTLE